MLEKHPNRVIVDVGGVGYDVAVPLSTFYTAGEPGAEITLRVHTHVREDQLALFGFATALELTVFERLIAVSGIGPKLALAVLSGIESRELVSRDPAQRSRPPDAHSRRRQENRRAHRHRAARSSAERHRSRRRRRGRRRRRPMRLRDDLVSALTNLGYHRQAIDQVLEKVDDSERFEDALRKALKELSRVRRTRHRGERLSRSDSRAHNRPDARVR